MYLYPVAYYSLSIFWMQWNGFKIFVNNISIGHNQQWTNPPKKTRPTLLLSYYLFSQLYTFWNPRNTRKEKVNWRQLEEVFSINVFIQIFLNIPILIRWSVADRNEIKRLCIDKNSKFCKSSISEKSSKWQSITL